MSKTWYPVIDYEKCIECGACTNKCTHGVYDLEKAPVPVVISPEGCVEGCHGCGNLCPAKAIQYLGNQKEESENCNCCCNDQREGCCS